MALTAAHAHCRFSYICAAGATDRAKTISIAQDPGGDIKVASDHDIVTAMSHLLDAPIAGFVSITLHLVEFLILPGIIFEHQLDVHSPDWNIRLQWLSALWAAMINAGMDSGRLETVELLRERVQHSMTLVSETERTLTLPNAIVNPVAEDTWWAHISSRRLRAGDSHNVVLSQMRNMVTGLCLYNIAFG